ncbi:hypothetical protein V1514DRAFT_299623 [Lipomyces japonicus]|uniref:uncharacterized protein n=1 Tax=Lipomyces japonicus TaxID=56871 RepID=UPI0034CE5F93
MSSWIRGLFSTASNNKTSDDKSRSQIESPLPSTTTTTTAATPSLSSDSVISVEDIIGSISGSSDIPAGSLLPAGPSSSSSPRQPEIATVKTFDNYVQEAKDYTMSHPIIIGAGIAALALATRVGIRAVQRYRNLPASASSASNKFYKGGFDNKMNSKEALLILGLNESSLSKAKLKESHRKIMLLNHPDRGGSPYLATKINEAKDFLEKRGRLR